MKAFYPKAVIDDLTARLTAAEHELHNAIRAGASDDEKKRLADIVTGTEMTITKVHLNACRHSWAGGVSELD